MILQAQTTDLRRISELGQAFYDECKIPGKFDPEFFIAGFTELMVKDLVEVWFAEHEKKIVGAIGLIFAPNFTSGELAAQEIFWYVSPDHRGSSGVKLIAMARARAMIRGANRLQMAALYKSPTMRSVVKLYEALGFEPLEMHYVLELWQS